jgi:hypothetical protein
MLTRYCFFLSFSSLSGIGSMRTLPCRAHVEVGGTGKEMD